LTLPTTIVTAATGNIAGLGLNLVLASAFAVVADDARLRTAELARGIDLDLDAVVGGLLQLRFVHLDVFMLHVVEGLGRELHGEVLRPRRRAREHEAGHHGQARNQQAPSPPLDVGSMITHVVPPSAFIVLAVMLIGSIGRVQRSTLSRAALQPRRVKSCERAWPSAALPVPP